MFTLIDRCGLFLKKWSISKKILAVLLVVAFVVSMIPIIVASFYSVPLADDYNFGYYTHKSFVEGTSFIDALIKTNVEYYKTWQGFFSSTSYAALQPFTMNIGLYFISNLIVIFSLAVGLLYLSKALLMNLMKLKVWDYLLITIPIVMCAFQFLPSISEGFYWMDGSLTVFRTSITFFIAGFTINYHLSTKKKSKILYIILVVLFELMIFGGGLANYLTVLLVSVLFFIYCLKKHYSVYKLLIVIMAIYTLGMIISLVAPGNTTRLEGDFTGRSFSLVSAVAVALFSSLVQFGKSFCTHYVAVMLFVSVVFFGYAKKSDFRFKNPLLVFLFAYAVYAARMSVQLYTAGYLGSPRQMNEYFLTFIIATSVSILYFIGWLSKRVTSNKGICSEKKVSVILLIMVLFLFGTSVLGYGAKNLASISTGLSLYRGELKQYKSEMLERVTMYENGKNQDVVVKPLSSYPACFQKESVSEDSDYWINRSIAEYYNNKSVTLKK